MADRWFIRPGYTSRESADYFDDIIVDSSGVVHQPDVYPFAFRLAAMWGRRTIIDVGCGRAHKLVASHPRFELIGIDIAANLEFCLATYDFGRWIEWDLESGSPLPIDEQTMANSVVICSDVIEHLNDPGALLAILAHLVDHGALLVLSTPERDLVRGVDDPGPPGNKALVREWALDELRNLLAWGGLEPDFIGLTRNNDHDSLKRTTIAVVDGSTPTAPPPSDFSVLAVMTTFNEEDVIETTIGHLIDEGVAVHVIDNWSTDETFTHLGRLAARGAITLERFPKAGPSTTYDWGSLLERVAQTGDSSRADWILHYDADEIRQSPWPGVTLRDALWAVDRAGFNVIDHTVIEFWPTPGGEGLPLADRPYFQFGSRWGHFVQRKGWRRDAGPARLARNGGHDVALAAQRVFPHKFLLRHYPVRSQRHGERKIFAERRDRWNPTERERGWHTHYDAYRPGDNFLREPADMLKYEEASFYRDYLVERLSGINLDGAPSDPAWA